METLLEQTPPGSKTSSKVSLAQGVVVDHTPLKIVAKTMDDETVVLIRNLSILVPRQDQ